MLGFICSNKKGVIVLYMLEHQFEAPLLKNCENELDEVIKIFDEGKGDRWVHRAVGVNNKQKVMSVYFFTNKPRNK